MAPACNASEPSLPDTSSLDELMALALTARERAYAPYSHFLVGAAVLTHDGRRFSGCNVENAAYGLCNCAERTALFSAIAAGCQRGDFAAMAVIAEGADPVRPCGACRQVMAELCHGGMPVFLGNLRGDSQSTSVSELLPGSFNLPTTG